MKQAEIMSKQEMICKLAGRTQRHLQETRKLSVPPSTTLGDVRRDGGSRAPDLACEPERLLPRKSSRGLVKGKCELMSFLPKLEASEVPHCPLISNFTARGFWLTADG